MNTKKEEEKEGEREQKTVPERTHELTPERTPEPWVLQGRIPCIEYDFRDPLLLRAALTHTSCAEENRNSYERLEYLGDRVLGLTVSEHLYHSFPGEDEGALSRRLHALVSKEALRVVARRLDLGDFLMHSRKGEATDSMLADCFEALIAAIFLDGGWRAACKFIECAMRAELENPPELPPIDPKTRLQEWSLTRRLGLPIYAMLGRSGPDHEPMFEVLVRIEGPSKHQAKGSGMSRRQAEMAAAANLLSKLPEPTSP